MSELTVDEVLIVRVATATCFAFPFTSAEIPPEDVDIYVGELLKLYASKPDAQLSGVDESPESLRSALEFCAERLSTSAPDQATRLRAALRES